MTARPLSARERMGTGSVVVAESLVKTGPSTVSVPILSQVLRLTALPLTALLLLFSTANLARAAEPDDYYERQLEAAGIEPDARGISRFLRSLLPDEHDREVERLIAQLGSPVFAEREQATRILSMMPSPPIAALKKAARSDDAEIRWRAKQILARTESGAHLSTLTAVLQAIQARKIKGLAPLLLELIPLWDDPHLVRAARQAMWVTARPEDASVLRKAVEADARSTRIAGIVGLAGGLGNEAAEDLIRLLADRDDRVRCRAARELANLGNRAGLKTLAELLESDDQDVRAEAGWILQAATGQQFGFLAYDEPERRAATVRAWRDWIATHAAMAELHFPLKETRTELGRTLLCVWSQKKLVELDSSGREIFSEGGYSYIWGCDGLPNGHRLAVDYNRQCVIEYDAAGKEFWRKDGLPGKPTCVERLPNGNTLLALSDSGLVVEIDRDGKTVWQVRLDGRPTSAARLDNGLTFVNLQFAKKVVEIDRTGKAVWELPGLNNPLNSQRLDNGHVLVCEMSQNKVIEYDRSGKVVWSKDGFRNPAQAQRISSGNTLIADETGLHEIDRAGNEVWHLKIPRSRFCRY